MWYFYFRRIVLTTFVLFGSALFVICLLLWNTFSAQADTDKAVLEFPFPIEGTELIAEHFVSHEGAYFEDQSGDFIIDGLALCVYNQGDTHIEFASVNIETRDGVYYFEGTCIPPQSKVVILEKYKSIYPETPVYFAAGRTVDSQTKSIMDEIDIKAVDLGRIEVTNSSERRLDNVLLYYKRYDSWWDTYLGGITYAVSAGTLQAGQSTILSPANYANGYSKVLYAVESKKAPN